MSRSSWGLSTLIDDWRERAGCRNAAFPDAWFVTGSTLSSDNRTALRVCRQGCPVQRQCRAYYDSLKPDLRQCVIAGGVWWDDRGQPREPPASFPPGLVPARDAARALGVVPQTVSVWCATGKLPGVRDERGRWQIDGEDLNRYVKVRHG